MNSPPGLRANVFLETVSLSLQEAQFAFLRALYTYITGLQAKLKGPKLETMAADG